MIARVLYNSVSIFNFHCVKSLIPCVITFFFHECIKGQVFVSLTIYLCNYLYNYIFRIIYIFFFIINTFYNIASPLIKNVKLIQFLLRSLNTWFSILFSSVWEGDLSFRFEWVRREQAIEKWQVVKIIEEDRSFLSLVE